MHYVIFILCIHIILYYIIFFYVILYCIILYYIILYYIIIYYIILCYNILYYIILYYIILYFILFYFIILYYIILYYIILYILYTTGGSPCIHSYNMMIYHSLGCTSKYHPPKSLLNIQSVKVDVVHLQDHHQRIQELGAIFVTRSSWVIPQKLVGGLEQSVIESGTMWWFNMV